MGRARSSFFARIAVVAGLLPAAAGGGAAEIDGVLEVHRVWAGHPVGFSLLTHPPYQFVGFYDAERKMTVGRRRLDERDWEFAVLPQRIGWDSHNYIAMTLDDEGYLHLAGNMHVHPLRYYRTEKPLDIASFVRVRHMVGSEEDRVTYPRFFRGANGELVFTYRDGSSGSGNQFYNVYDVGKRAWRRLLEEPLTDGQGKMNAYLNGPLHGPDGYYHLCWVWRDTPDCATNHDLCYARSRDLVHWEKGTGEVLTLPITLSSAEVVDPVPPGGGIINGNTKIGFDAQQRPVIAYHKFDADGITQLYNARLEDGAWRVYQSSDWDYRWEFAGGGSIPFEVRVEPLRAEEDGSLVQGWSHERYGKQRWRLDSDTLKPLERLERPSSGIPAGLGKVESDFEGMQVEFASDSGKSDVPGARYVLRWETLGHHRDRRRDKPWPAPSMLRVYRITE